MSPKNQEIEWGPPRIGASSNTYIGLFLQRAAMGFDASMTHAISVPQNASNTLDVPNIQPPPVDGQSSLPPVVDLEAKACPPTVEQSGSSEDLFGDIFSSVMAELSHGSHCTQIPDIGLAVQVAAEKLADDFDDDARVDALTRLAQQKIEATGAFGPNGTIAVPGNGQEADDACQCLENDQDLPTPTLSAEEQESAFWEKAKQQNLVFDAQGRAGNALAGRFRRWLKNNPDDNAKHEALNGRAALQTTLLDKVNNVMHVDMRSCALFVYV